MELCGFNSCLSEVKLSSSPELEGGENSGLGLNSPWD